MAVLFLSYNLFYRGELFVFYLPTALTSAETDFKLRTSSFKLGSLNRVRSRGARRNVNHTNLPLSSGARTGSMRTRAVTSLPTTVRTRRTHGQCRMARGWYLSLFLAPPPHAWERTSENVRSEVTTTRCHRKSLMTRSDSWVWWAYLRWLSLWEEVRTTQRDVYASDLKNIRC